MLYDENASYNESFFQYNGIRVVLPQSISPTFAINNPKLLGVIVVTPLSINSTLKILNDHQIVIPSGVIEVTESTSYMTFSTINNQEGYIIFNVLDESSIATVDVTIIPTA